LTPFGEIVSLRPQTDEVVTLKKRTMADIKKEQALGKAPQLEKDIANFNLKNLSHDN
jgi:hypothetical protein